MSTNRIVFAALALGAAANADLTPVPAGSATRVDPARVAGIRLTPGGGWERTTPWMPYAGSGTDAQETPVYDSIDLNGGCEGGGGYLFRDDAGAIAHVPSAVSNMRIADEFRAVPSGRAQFMYYWTDNGSPLSIAIFTAENVSTDCSLPAADHFYDGIVYGFNSIGTGFYYTDADTEGNGLFFTMPADGEGGFVMSFSTQGPCDPDPCDFGPAQFYLFGTGNNGGSPGRPGESSDPTWADFDASGDFDPQSECVSLAGQGFCPDPPTLAVAFWTDENNGVCSPDCDGDFTLSFFDFLCFTNDFNADGEFSDCDENESHDLFDFLCFVNLFNDGC